MNSIVNIFEELKGKIARKDYRSLKKKSHFKERKNWLGEAATLAWNLIILALDLSRSHPTSCQT